MNNPVTKEHLYWLDWLRFTAALMVVVCHTRGANWAEWGKLNSLYQTKAAFVFFAATRVGFEWVIVFFALSGFLVGGKVLDRVARGNFDVKAYAIDRFSRIWIPLFPALLLTAGIAYVRGFPVSFSEFIGNLFGLQGLICDNFGRNVPLWSLAYEIWFYFLAGCAAIAVSHSPRKFYAYIGLAIGLGVFTRLEPTMLYIWILGAISYRFIHIRFNWKILLTGLFLVIAGILMTQLKLETTSLNINYIQRFIPSQNVTILVLGFGLTLILPFLSRLRPHSDATAAFERLGSHLAAMSYTLYLTHYPLLGLWEYFFPQRIQTLHIASFILFFGKILSCLIVAWLLYLPFEARTASVRSWLRKRL